MPTVDPDDLITIEEAATKYNRSRRWLESQVDPEGKLSLVKIPGDRKSYLLRSELDAFIQPQIVKPADQQAG